MTIYAKRWEIESLFACLKGRGFNLEETHLTKMDRVSKLVAVNALAFCWAYHVGIHHDKQRPLKRKPKVKRSPSGQFICIRLGFVD